MRGWKLCACAIFAVVAPNVASADPLDWRFCVATDFAHHIAYLTELFESDASAKAVGGVVANILTKQNLSFENIQCPLPHDRLTLEGKQFVAEKFLKNLGYRIVAVK